jgi:hypothetical protein
MRWSPVGSQQQLNLFVQSEFDPFVQSEFDLFVQSEFDLFDGSSFDPHEEKGRSARGEGKMSPAHFALCKEGGEARTRSAKKENCMFAGCMLFPPLHALSESLTATMHVR